MPPVCEPTPYAGQAPDRFPSEQGRTQKPHQQQRDVQRQQPQVAPPTAQARSREVPKPKVIVVPVQPVPATQPTVPAPVPAHAPTPASSPVTAPSVVPVKPLVVAPTTVPTTTGAADSPPILDENAASPWPWKSGGIGGSDLEDQDFTPKRNQPRGRVPQGRTVRPRVTTSTGDYPYPGVQVPGRPLEPGQLPLSELTSVRPDMNQPQAQEYYDKRAEECRRSR
jgi:hypothetical protein